MAMRFCFLKFNYFWGVRSFEVVFLSIGGKLQGRWCAVLGQMSCWYSIVWTHL